MEMQTKLANIYLMVARLLESAWEEYDNFKIIVSREDYINLRNMMFEQTGEWIGEEIKE